MIDCRALELTIAKTFSLGGKASEVQISLHLLGATAKALRTSYVDDVHLCLRIADLLDGLLSSITAKFIRLPPRPLSSPELARRNTMYLDNPQSGQSFDPSHQFNSYWSNLGGSDSGQNPLAGLPRSYNNPHDSNISIVPPIGNTYLHSNANNTSYQFASPSSSTYSTSQQPNYNMAGNNDFSMPTEEDWLTLNMNPLLGGDGSGMSGADGQWLSAFGPEMADNLEVLGKLTGEQGYGNNGGMGGY